jgi:hypothetical protein
LVGTVGDQRQDVVAELLDELALDPLHPRLFRDLGAPVGIGRSHRQAAMVPVGQAPMQGLGVGKFGS